MSVGSEERPTVALRPKRAKAKRHALTHSLLADARLLQANKTDATFAIDNPRGLSVRVRNGEIYYYVQARGPQRVVKRKICRVGEVTFAEIKKIATNAVGAIKKGRAVDIVIETGLAKLSDKQVEVQLDRMDASVEGLWTFGKAIDEFTARTVTVKGLAKPKFSESYLREISDRLREKAEAVPLMSRYVKELRLDDIEKVRDEISASGAGESSVGKFVDLSKRILNWAAKHRRRLTGLDPIYPWWTALVHEYKPADRRDRYLTPAQVGMLIALLEAVRELEDRSNNAVFGALQLDWLLVQRSAALVAMEALTSSKWKDDPAEERMGWRVYSWDADEVKGKRTIKLSIPPIVIKIFERVTQKAFSDTNVSSFWAFPQCRNKFLLRAYAASNNTQGIRQFDKHITPSALNHALDALAGLKPGWPNLLEIAGLPLRIGPQDSRRSVTTFFENRGHGAYASALLDHKVAGVDKMSERVAAVTQGTYSAADRIIFKAEALKLWLDSILPYYEQAKLDPRLKIAIAARRESLNLAKERGLAKRAATLGATHAKAR